MKKSINKSELIRSAIAKNPAAKATEILAILKKDGVSVSLPLIYNAMRKKGTPKAKAGKKRGRKPGSTKAAAISSTTNDLFATMQTFVNAAGSLDKAIEILSVFKK
jgi:hypothetical protein